MSEKHTPGRIKVVITEHPHHLGGVHVERRLFTVWDHPQLKGPMGVVNSSIGIGSVEGGPVRHMVEISEADAERLAACWNACEGIPTDVLEDVPGVVAATLPYHRLTAQRAELLAALLPFATYNSSEEWITIRVRTADVSRARTAIASATAPNYQGQALQPVLKAEAETPDATDRGAPVISSPDGGPMGAGQPAAAGPAGGQA